MLTRIPITHQQWLDRRGHTQSGGRSTTRPTSKYMATPPGRPIGEKRNGLIIESGRLSKMPTNLNGRYDSRGFKKFEVGEMIKVYVF